MKIIFIIAIIAIVSFVTALHVKTSKTANALQKENIEVLADDEANPPVSYSNCYSQYDFSLIKRVLRCGDCIYRWGVGTEEGGVCIW